MPVSTFRSSSSAVTTTYRAIGPALESGAVEFLIKPFGDQVLLDAIQGALNRDRAMRQK
jgi:FixJ family two-component response regulator